MLCILLYIVFCSLQFCKQCPVPSILIVRNRIYTVDKQSRQSRSVMLDLQANDVKNRSKCEKMSTCHVSVPVISRDIYTKPHECVDIIRRTS